MPEETKQCTKCKEFKPVSEFPKDRQKRDGLSSICKQCNKDKVKAYMRTEEGKTKRKEYEQTEAFKLKRSQYNRSEQGKQRHKRYRATPKGKLAARLYDQSDIVREKARQYRQQEHVKRKMRELRPLLRTKNIEKEKAREAVHTKVKLGQMPHVTELHCIDCGNQAREYHHHCGYSPEHWLDVVPLCKNCHELRHHPMPTSP